MMYETIDHHREDTTHLYKGTGDHGTGSITECGVELPHSPVTSYNIKRLNCVNCLRILRARADKQLERVQERNNG